MAARLSILQLGKGAIGSALVDQVAARRQVLKGRLGVDLVYVGIAGRSAGAFAPGGLDLARWRAEVEAGVGLDGRRLLKEASGAVSETAVLVDATAEDGLADLYCDAVEAGFHIVTCNKKPLAGALADYRRIKETCRRKRRFFLHEVTVGAGLPVIATLRDLLDSGDRVAAIEGCFSGTLNFLCAALDRGEKFSQGVARARELGYTEPDPRDDLAGTDVARKALILAREAGMDLEPSDVRLEPFCAAGREGDVAAFLGSVSALDAEMARRWREAAGRGARWRYVARVDGGCGAGPAEVPAEGALGRLAGPENVFAFRTERYTQHPLVVAGPGAGPAVTAAGAFGDLLKVARSIARTV
jgi:aspartokinase/homoserine dehydrogenase 1